MFGVLVLLLVASSLRLQVYAHVTVARVTAVAVAPTGARTPIPVPEGLRGVSSDVSGTAARVRRYARSTEARMLAPTGGRVEWYVRSSKDSLRFDRAERVATTGRP